MHLGGASPPPPPGVCNVATAVVGGRYAEACACMAHLVVSSAMQEVIIQFEEAGFFHVNNVF